ncbi:NUDIX domain-containing protein [Streptomyces olivaceoviridis]
MELVETFSEAAVRELAEESGLDAGRRGAGVRLRPTHRDRPLSHHVQAKMSAVCFQTAMPAQPSAQYQ